MFAGCSPALSILPLRVAIPLLSLGAGLALGQPAAAGGFAFSETGSLMTARAYHTATLLGDGRVLVAAGSTGSETFVSAELYDPATGTWSETGSLAVARYRHSATL